MNTERIKKLIDDSILNYSLNLSGLTVLTEAATGYYILTPIIAALGQADCVLGLTRDSRYGKANHIGKETMKLARNWNVEDKIQIICDRNDDRIGSADIITNLGFVRPIDSDFLKKVKKTAVIPLMWETWEYRPEDLDLEECRRLQIPVLGTNEHHPDLMIFEYIGYIALKLLFEAEIEVLSSKIALLGVGEFAEQVKKTLKIAKSDVRPIFQNSSRKTVTGKSKNFLKHADALIIVESDNKKELIGPKGLINGEELFSLNKYITIIHICGNVDQNNLKKNGIRCWPSNFSPAGYMSVATDYVGPTPLIKLHSAGLKVGERLVHARKRYLTSFEAEQFVLNELAIAQGFSGYHTSKDLYI
jgi:hypothetical protein